MYNNILFYIYILSIYFPLLDEYVLTHPITDVPYGGKTSASQILSNYYPFPKMVTVDAASVYTPPTIPTTGIPPTSTVVQETTFESEVAGQVTMQSTVPPPMKEYVNNKLRNSSSPATISALLIGFIFICVMYIKK